MVRSASESRPEPSASGTLEKRPALHLLVYSRERHLTGTLEVDAPNGECGVVVLSKGRVVKARADRAGAYLGSVAYELGLVDAATLDATLRELSAGKKKHGEILLARKALTRDQLSTVLEEQILRKLTHLHTLPPESAFAFYQAYDGLGAWPADGPHVDPLPAVWRGARDSASRAHVETVLARLGDAAWQLAATAQTAFFAFDAETAALVDQLRAPMRIADFLAHAGGARPRAERLVYTLALTKAIEPVDAAHAPPSIGPTRAAAPATHPSGTYTRHISFELRTPKVSTAPPSPSAPPPSQRMPARVSSSVPPDPDLAPPTRAQIALKASRLAHESFYELLGVERTASVEEIRAAFFRLSRTWRPERLPQDLADVRALCAAVRARMEEAHRTLTDPEARARYDLIGHGSAPPSKRIDAESVFKEAEIALARKDYIVAAELCKRAQEVAPEESRYAALLVWIDALAVEGDATAHLRDFIARLDPIVRDDPMCESALFYRGTFLRRLGEDDAAMRDFSRVVTLNPKNIEAAREVRLYNMRHGKKH